MFDPSAYSTGFEEDEPLRSGFIRGLILHQLRQPLSVREVENKAPRAPPKTLVRFWHDPSDLPEDVKTCLDSWETLRDQGFTFRMFDDASAATYIQGVFGSHESRAFSLCRHPAMRSDYLRLCFMVAEGGLYVDADDVLLGDAWKLLFADARLKLQPLCYDIASSGMVPASEIWRPDLTTAERIFYVNNDPIAAPPGHPVLARALRRATARLLGADPRPEIQSTTGPGNLTAALAAHARELLVARSPLDFELLHDWEAIAETRWNLSYRNDGRNWRNMDD